MDTTQYHKLTDKYALNVLYQIRAEIVREGLPNLEAVDALIKARGADPGARLIRTPRPARFKRNELIRSVLRALRRGPQTTARVAAQIGNHPGVRDCVADALKRLCERGLVQVVAQKRGRTPQVWKLAP